MTDNVTEGTTSYVADAGNSFIHTNSFGDDNEVSEFYGSGFALQHTKGNNAMTYQYGGPYAAQARMPTTQPIATATELVVRDQAPIALTLLKTTQGSTVTTPMNEYALSAANGTVFTGDKALRFQTEQAKLVTGASGQVDITDAVVPLYGMVQIDLPEDLIQAVYRRYAYSGIGTTEGDATGAGSLSQSILTARTDTVLNANFSVLVEYGFSV